MKRIDNDTWWRTGNVEAWWEEQGMIIDPRGHLQAKPANDQRCRKINV